MIKVKYPVALVVVFVWIGFVCAISFMEAWLKFQAPGITLSLGLGIGRLVFNALNKVEWILAIAVIGNILLYKEWKLFPGHILFLIPFLILIVQTFWLLPFLDARAEMILSGHHPSDSNLHFYYVIFEFIKVVSLFIFGIKLFSSDGSRTDHSGDYRKI